MWKAINEHLRAISRSISSLEFSLNMGNRFQSKSVFQNWHIFGHAKVAEIACALSFGLEGSKLSLVYRQGFPRHRPIFKIAMWVET